MKDFGISLGVIVAMVVAFLAYKNWRKTHPIGSTTGYTTDSSGMTTPDTTTHGSTGNYSPDGYQPLQYTHWNADGSTYHNTTPNTQAELDAHKRAPFVSAPPLPSAAFAGLHSAYLNRIVTA